MSHTISMDVSRTMGKLNGRLDALKVRYVSTSDNQQSSGDGDLNKIMDRDLYEAILKDDLEKFVEALEKVSESRKLALSLIFDQVTPSGNSLLHVAARAGRVDVAELILFHYPDLMTWKNSLEDTPLHVAIQHGMSPLTKMLIDRRRDSEFMYCENKDKKSPLYMAAEIGRLNIFQPLLEAYAQDEAYAVKIQGMSPVLAALKVGKSDILGAIINQLPNLLHVRGEDKKTPLHYAASVGDDGAVELLLTKCPYLALQMDEKGSYPIHIACEGDNVEILRKLVEMWPYLEEIKNEKGQNILHVAAKGGNNNMVQWILKGYNWDAKKMANSKDVDGNTPLHLASMHNHCTVMRSLTKDNISDFQLLNNEELTALDVAMDSGSVSTKDPALLGRAILIVAGARRSQDILSPRERRSRVSKSTRAEWIKKQVNTLLLVATLVASVTFTAGVTLPGGYNASSDPHPGTATMLHHGEFRLFIIADMLAMYSSILAVVVLLWGLSSDLYIAELAYHSAGPLLLMALIGMTVAFFAAITAAVSKLTWLGSLVLSIGVLYLVMVIMVLAALIFPFSKFAMRIVSLHYLVVALLVSAIQPLVILRDFVIICIIRSHNLLFT